MYTLQKDIKHITWYADSNLREDSLVPYVPAKLFPLNVLDPSEGLEA